MIIFNIAIFELLRYYSYYEVFDHMDIWLVTTSLGARFSVLSGRTTT